MSKNLYQKLVTCAPPFSRYHQQIYTSKFVVQDKLCLRTYKTGIVLYPPVPVSADCRVSSVCPVMRSCLLPLLLLLLAAASVSKAVCPEDWMAYGDKCYKLVDSSMTWEDADEACGLVHTGATLASAHNIEQNAFLAETVPNYGAVWLGLRRPTTDGNWIWTDGSSYDFYYWYPPDEPYGDGERCARLNCGIEGMWCTQPCNNVNNEHRFICQIDA